MVEGLLLAVALAGGVATLLFQGVALLFAVRMPHLFPLEGPPAPGLPSVSVVVAARNEEEAIGLCLDDLLRQEYPGPLEIVVVDGGSTDRTREVVRSRGARVVLMEEPPLPSGWVGKNWGCQVGARETSGEYLLFSDADIRYHPRAVETVVEWARREGADLATVGSRIEMHGFWENVVMPFYTQAVLTYFRAPDVNRAGSSAAIANGQFLLTRRAAYEEVGGHEAVRGVVLEDVRLAQLFREAGKVLRIAWAPEMVATRMYRNRREMFEGLLKNVHGIRFSMARQVGFLAALLGFFLLPLAILPVGLWTASPLIVGVGAFVYLALFGKHAGFTRAIGGRTWAGLLFPVAVVFYLVLVSVSIREGRAHAPLRWKGRLYPRDG
jgi:chlorobactene glucosyltransferase